MIVVCRAIFLLITKVNKITAVSRTKNTDKLYGSIIFH